MSQHYLRHAKNDDMFDVLDWRNQEHVRAVMLTTEIISQENHKKWWQSKIDDANFRLLILEKETVPMATCSFFDITQEGTAWWAFYFTPNMPDDLGKMMRIWQALEYSSLYYAFEILGLKVVYCEVLKSNQAVLDWHKRYGFKSCDPAVSPNAAHHDLEVMSFERSQFDNINSKKFDSFTIEGHS